MVPDRHRPGDGDVHWRAGLRGDDADLPDRSAGDRRYDVISVVIRTQWLLFGECQLSSAQPVQQRPLVALATGGNGAAVYGTGSAALTNTYQATNYWATLTARPRSAALTVPATTRRQRHRR